MNYRDFQSIIINDQLLHGEEILRYCTESDVENIRLAGHFLSEWQSDNPEITVQTSGSTGKPKSINVRKDQMLASAAMTAAYFGFKQGMTALLALPVNYIAGKMMLIRAMFSQLNLHCIEPNNNPIANIPEDKVIDFAPFVPMQLNGVTHTKSIRNILLGGAPIDTELQHQLTGLNADIFHGYGMTETLSHIAIRKVNGKESSDVYSAIKGVRFEQDKDSCLVIHVPFLEIPIITRDVVSLLDEHRFIWQSRADYVVNSGGVKLFPESIEQKLSGVIKDKYFVGGIPDSKYGEKLCLFIESTPYNPENYEELKSKMEELLDKYEKPQEIFFIPKFKWTASGKIQRKATIFS